jgi:hypothetical protein
MSKRLLFIVLSLAAGLNYAKAATYYVSPTGNDSRAGTSLADAWATFSRAWSVMRAGDTLLVADGTYRQRIAPTISGTSGAPVTIRAINDGRAVIDGDTNGDGIGDLNSGPLLSLERDYRHRVVCSTTRPYVIKPVR